MNSRSRSHLPSFGSNKGWIVVLAAVFLVGFEVFLSYSGIGHYDDFYDAGVYLESARMMNRGAQLYSTIFDSQPPLWLLMIYGSFCVLGESFFAGQFPIATTGLIIALATGIIGKQVAGWSAAGIAASTVILSPLELQWSRTVSPEVPASALAVIGMLIAMHYVRHGSRAWICLASLSVAFSVLVKLLGLFTAPVLFVIVAVRHWKLFREHRQVDWKSFVEDQLIVLGTLIAVILSAVFAFGPKEVWKQVIEFHWAARSASSVDSVNQTARILIQLFANDWFLAAASLFGIMTLVSGPEGAAVAGWILICVIGLLCHRPLFSHHAVVLIPPLAIAAGIGWSEFWKRIARRAQSFWATGDSSRMIAAGALMFLGIASAVSLSLLALYQAVDQVRGIERRPAYADDLEAAHLIDCLTAGDAMVLTDAQGIAFLARRDVPPQLTDTSFVRIATHYLTTEKVIAYSELYDVQIFLSWTGRLASMPGIMQWAERRFPYHRVIGPGRDLYSTKCADCDVSEVSSTKFKGFRR
jgi:4-amino-4-deoxy-L-arabinose transferase-like glycosyltransferase